MRSSALFAAVCGLLALSGCARDSLNAPTTEAGLGAGVNGAVVLLPRWKWQDIMSNMGRIRDNGFTALVISPHTATCGGAASSGYDPSDFTSFNSGFGSESDLGWLVGTAHYYNLQIYADMVMNHMCPANYVYPRFSWNDFHHNGPILDFNNQWQRENCDLFGLNDLAQESAYVQGELFNYLVKTNSLGFDGYRWDAAKHVPHWFWQSQIVNNVNTWGKFSYGEVYDSNLDMLQSYVDTGMAVTDYNLYDAIRNNFVLGGNLAALDGAGYAMRNGAKAVTFVENQDVGPPTNRTLAYAFLSAYPGYPMYMDSCLDDPAMKNLVWIHDNLASGPYVSRWAAHDFLIFERAGHLLAAINQSGSWVNQWVPTSWSSTKLHDYSGHVGDQWTNADATIQVAIPPGSYVMLAP
jgi:alpha-amylase